MNLHGFAGNNGVNLVDPFGLRYSKEECAALMNEIDFLTRLSTQAGMDKQSIMKQIIDLDEEYQENCPDDDDGSDDDPDGDPVPLCPTKKREPVLYAPPVFLVPYGAPVANTVSHSCWPPHDYGQDISGLITGVSVGCLVVGGGGTVVVGGWMILPGAAGIPLVVGEGGLIWRFAH